MVKFSEPQLDRVFSALADPTRRAILARLSLGEISISELAEPLPMSLPAVMKHLDVLTDAGLVSRTKTGRTVACALKAQPMESASDWLERYRVFWSGSLDRLGRFLEDETPPKPKPRSKSKKQK